MVTFLLLECRFLFTAVMNSMNAAQTPSSYHMVQNYGESGTEIWGERPRYGVAIVCVLDVISILYGTFTSNK